MNLRPSIAVRRAYGWPVWTIPWKGIPTSTAQHLNSIRNRAEEPILLMCHAPDFVDDLLKHPAERRQFRGCSAATLTVGRFGSHFGPPLELPELGKKYVEGLIHLQGLQLYVNRGIGAVGVPFRLNCPPEITSITLHRA